MTQRKFDILWDKHCEFNAPSYKQQSNINAESNEVKYIDQLKTEKGMSFWDL